MLKTNARVQGARNVYYSCSESESDEASEVCEPEAVDDDELICAVTEPVAAVVNELAPNLVSLIAFNLPISVSIGGVACSDVFKASALAFATGWRYLRNRDDE